MGAEYFKHVFSVIWSRTFFCFPQSERISARLGRIFTKENSSNIGTFRRKLIIFCFPHEKRICVGFCAIFIKGDSNKLGLTWRRGTLRGEHHHRIAYSGCEIQETIDGLGEASTRYRWWLDGRRSCVACIWVDVYRPPWEALTRNGGDHQQCGAYGISKPTDHQHEYKTHTTFTSPP